MRFLAAALAAVCALTVSAAPRPGVGAVVYGQAYLPLTAVAGSCRLRLSTANGQLRLTGPGGWPSLTMQSRRRTMTLNGRRIMLNHPVTVRYGAPMVSEVDWRTTLRPLLYPRSVTPHPVREIYLDFGHGGVDKGASGAFSREKDLNLKLGLRVAGLLRANGFKVRLTRFDDRTVPLDLRGKMLARCRCDLLISLHVNASADRKLSGIETFCLTPGGAASSNGGKVSYARHAGNRCDANNALLAHRIQNALLARTGAVDLGVKHARFAVLKDLTMPGVLVEVGFISNRAEERNLNSPAYREKLARGIVDGVLAYRSCAAPRKR